MIRVQALSKLFRVPVRESTARSVIRSLFRRSYRPVRAVNEVSFDIAAGEIVGFLGPNGAGKTTTLKMLSGLLIPTSGSARVLGHTPWERRKGYLSQIAMVLGNKSQLTWDIPPGDTFEVLRAIYSVPRLAYRRTVEELVELLQAAELLHKPVRTLSLGERMKCELIAAFIHRPRVLFLDEPTLGLDVSMQRRLRKFIRDRNSAEGTTVLITSHYMADVVALCERVLLIDKGALVYDGLLRELGNRLAPFKLLTATVSERPTVWPPLPGGLLLRSSAHEATYRVARAGVTVATAALIDKAAPIDLSVVDPPIEDVIDQMYEAGGAT